MTSDIAASLKLDKENQTSSVIVVKEINGCNSSFLSSCLLGHCVKNKQAVLFVSTHDCFSHYQNIGLRMNYNLQKCIDSKTFIFYDLGKDLIDSILRNETCLKQNIFLNIRKMFLLLKENNDSVNVIIDGISHFLDFGFSVADVNNLCKDVTELVGICKNSFVLFHCNVANEDDITYSLANLLSHRAQTVIAVESLPSGWSADVSGHLTIQYLTNKFEKEHTFILDPKPAKYLFKLFDRGVKLLAPGTV